MFLSFCCASAASPLATLLPKGGGYVVLFVMYLAAFVLPTVLLRATLPSQIQPLCRIGLKISTSTILYFTLWGSLAVAVAGFLADYLILQACTANWLSALSAVPAFSAHGSPLLRLLLFAFFIPVTQEIFLRGALFRIQEQVLRTGVCILFSGIFSFMLPNVTGNWLGAALTGLLCAYVTYVFDCVWPAVLVQICSFLYRYFMIWVATTYSSLGIWRYFPALGVLFLLFFLYLSCRSMVTLLMEKRIALFRSGKGARESLLFFLNPGFAAFLLAFIVKIIMNLA